VPSRRSAGSAGTSVGASLQLAISVALPFSETLDAKESKFKLIGSSGIVGTGAVADDPAGMALGGLTLEPGDYEIRRTAVADDGHVERGTLVFFVV
jgi:methionine-rich copper-binding protein CopC